MQPLKGIRVLAMEQAVALPFTTRHLADLGAEVIRVQSHKRAVRLEQPLAYYRNKHTVGLDLSMPEGPEVFRALAAQCDIVAHNYTPRVMEKFGLDFASIRAVQPRVIYCALTGFGNTGPWRSRPLFGPGAEAMSGHNAMMGEPEALIPGRPGTITYADHVCGLYLLFAILGALQQRDMVDTAQLIDISLYEACVSHLGTVISERSLGAMAPYRCGNAEYSQGLQQVLETADAGYVAITCHHDQSQALRDALAVRAFEDVPERVMTLTAVTTVELLQHAGIACAKVQDMRDVVTDPRRWQRGCFAVRNDQLVLTPVWGGQISDISMASSIGADNAMVVRDVAGFSPPRIQTLLDNETLGERPVGFDMQPSRTQDVDIERGLLQRVDPEPLGWREYASTELTPVVSVGETVHTPLRRRVLEVASSVAVAYVGRLFADLGWDVLCVVIPEHNAEALPYRWGAAQGGAQAFLNQGKRSISLDSTMPLSTHAAEADVVLGDASVWELAGRYVTACITPFGRHGQQIPWSDLTVQAASGFMSLTGEYDQVPQQLPPFAAQLTGAVGVSSAILAAVMAAQQDHTRRRLDMSLVDVLTGFVHLQAAQYAATGEVARREGRVKHAMRMVPTAEGFLYCAPGAVMTVDMHGVATLLDEPRLAEERFQTAEGRMQHWDEYVEFMVTNFQNESAAYWFEKAAELHLTFALVQSIDDLLQCPQLAARGMFKHYDLDDGRQATVPGPAFRLTSVPLSA